MNFSILVDMNSVWSYCELLLLLLPIQALNVAREITDMIMLKICKKNDSYCSQQSAVCCLQLKTENLRKIDKVKLISTKICRSFWYLICFTALLSFLPDFFSSFDLSFMTQTTSLKNVCLYWILSLFILLFFYALILNEIIYFFLSVAPTTLHQFVITILEILYKYW